MTQILSAHRIPECAAIILINLQFIRITEAKGIVIKKPVANFGSIELEVKKCNTSITHVVESGFQKIVYIPYSNKIGFRHLLRNDILNTVV